MKKLKIEKYVSNPDRFVSVLKNVPIEHLECVREEVKRAAARVEAIATGKLEVRVRFRQSTMKNRYGDNYKDGADAFDVYVDTNNIPSKYSMKRRQQIIEENRQDIIDTLRYESSTLSC